MGHIAPLGKAKYTDGNGVPIAGGKLYTYAAGTTTPLATYTDKAETAANTNPIILDANGEAVIFLTSAAYKFVLKTPLDVALWTVDGIATINDASITTAKLADGILSNDIPGHAKMADGYLSNDTPGRLKMADGFLSATTDGRPKMADGFITALKYADASITNVKMAAASVGTSNLIDGSVTQVKKATVGQQLSASSGTFNTASATAVDVPGLTVTITSTARPIFLTIQPDGNVNNGGYIGAGGGTNNIIQVYLLRGATVIAAWYLSCGSNINGPFSFTFVDTPTAGTLTYKVQVAMQGTGASVNVGYIRLMAFEL